MELLIKRVRLVQQVLGAGEEVRDSLRHTLVVEGDVSDEEFYLAWNAAKILENKKDDAL
jgi:hypothetical protein